MSGPIALVGAGEFLPAMAGFDAHLLASTGRARPRVAIVPTALFAAGIPQPTEAQLQAFHKENGRRYLVRNHQKLLGKRIGPLQHALKGADDAARPAVQAELDALAAVAERAVTDPSTTLAA